MKLSIIVATDLNGAIGIDNQLPWHMPADLAHFKKVTMGKPVIMGRKTFESIGRPLPGRINVIVSKTLSANEWSQQGVIVVDSLSAALTVLAKHEEAFVIGGGQLYREALPIADLLYLTKIHTLVESADTWFPKVASSEWRYVEGTTLPADVRNPYVATYLKMESVEANSWVALGHKIIERAKVDFPGQRIYLVLQNHGGYYTYMLSSSDDHTPLQIWKGLNARLVASAINRWLGTNLILGEVLCYE